MCTQYMYKGSNLGIIILYTLITSDYTSLPPADPLPMWLTILTSR